MNDEIVFFYSYWKSHCYYVTTLLVNLYVRRDSVTGLVFFSLQSNCAHKELTWFNGLFQNIIMQKYQHTSVCVAFNVAIAILTVFFLILFFMFIFFLKPSLHFVSTNERSHLLISFKTHPNGIATNVLIY